jgi:hypothetical protein
MFPTIFLIAVALAWFGVGSFFVIGTLKKVDCLVRPPDADDYPFRLLIYTPKGSGLFCCHLIDVSLMILLTEVKCNPR